MIEFRVHAEWKFIFDYSGTVIEIDSIGAMLDTVAVQSIIIDVFDSTFHIRSNIVIFIQIIPFAFELT